MSFADALERLNIALHHQRPLSEKKIEIRRDDLRELLNDWVRLDTQVQQHVAKPYTETGGEHNQRVYLAPNPVGFADVRVAVTDYPVDPNCLVYGVKARNSGIRWYCELHLDRVFMLVAERDTQNGTFRQCRTISVYDWISARDQRALFTRHVEHMTHVINVWS